MILWHSCPSCGRTVGDTAHLAKLPGQTLLCCSDSCRRAVLAEAAAMPTSAAIASTTDRISLWVGGIALALVVFAVIEQATRPAQRPTMPNPMHTSYVWGLEEGRGR